MKVWVENYRSEENRHVSSAYLTFVAVDAAGNRVPVPPVIPETDDQKRRYEGAAAPPRDRRAETVAVEARHDRTVARSHRQFEAASKVLL